MVFIIENEKDKYINIIYMNNTFKLWFKKKLWSEFTSLHYDKNITMDSLFKLSHSKNLYNNIHHNNRLEFNHNDIFNDIKIIIKNNLDSQLGDWEKKKPFLDKLETKLYSSYTPDIKLEKAINYTHLYDNDIDNNKGLDEYLLKISGVKNTNIKNKQNEEKEEKKNISKKNDNETLIDIKILKDTNKMNGDDYLKQRVNNFLKNEIEKDMKSILKEKYNTKKEVKPEETQSDYTINTTEVIDDVSVKKQYVIPEKTYGINSKLNKFINDAEKKIYAESYNKLHDRIFDVTNDEDSLKYNEKVHDFLYKELNNKNDVKKDITVNDEDSSIYNEKIHDFLCKEINIKNDEEINI